MNLGAWNEGRGAWNEEGGGIRKPEAREDVRNAERLALTKRLGPRPLDPGPRPLAPDLWPLAPDLWPLPLFGEHLATPAKLVRIPRKTDQATRLVRNREGGKAGGGIQDSEFRGAARLFSRRS